MVKDGLPKLSSYNTQYYLQRIDLTKDILK